MLTPEVQEQLKAACLKGAALLDEKKPGWAELISVDGLDMGGATHCVLGQLYGGFMNGVVKLDIDDGGNSAGDHGFYVFPSSDAHERNVFLYDCWVDQIDLRFVAAP